MKAAETLFIIGMILLGIAILFVLLAILWLVFF